MGGLWIGKAIGKTRGVLCSAFVALKTGFPQWPRDLRAETVWKMTEIIM
jgi:hypothetical protein